MCDRGGQGVCPPEVGRGGERERQDVRGMTSCRGGEPEGQVEDEGGEAQPPLHDEAGGGAADQVRGGACRC